MYRRICCFGKNSRSITWTVSKVSRPAVELRKMLVSRQHSITYTFGRPIGGSLPHARRQIEKYANVRLTVQQRTESPCTKRKALRFGCRFRGYSDPNPSVMVASQHSM